MAFPDLVKSSPLGFYSSSVKDFKSWYISPAPSRNWFFKSDSIRTYHPDGAADPSYKWIAVPYFQKKDTSSGIELRNIITGEKKSLKFMGDYVYHLDFFNNGNWLVLETSEKIHFWNTTSWNYFNFPLVQNDRQFISLNIKSDTVFASLAEDSAGYVIDYSFILENSNPRFLKRVLTNLKFKDRYASKTNNENIGELVKGWKMDKLYKYTAAGWAKSGSWAIRLTCRDNPLGAEDCDVLFIPTDLLWLTKVYNSLLWRPTKEELNKIRKGEN